MNNTRLGRASLALFSAVVLIGSVVSAEAARGSSSSLSKPTIVLVHGAFADGTGWQHVIPILERDGDTVLAVQNALASLAGDVQTTKRLIDAQVGPVVVVGHSYGGAVITGAAVGNANVKSLVYIAAFAPDSGERIDAYSETYPSALGSAQARLEMPLRA
jgi:pimeloyl-ACP methyl ester carboxylesterase